MNNWFLTITIYAIILYLRVVGDSVSVGVLRIGQKTGGLWRSVDSQTSAGNISAIPLIRYIVFTKQTKLALDKQLAY